MEKTKKDFTKKRKHNYPKERKPKNTDYSTITKLIKALGMDKVKEISTTVGTYSGAKLLYELSGIYVPNSTVLSMRKKFGWVTGRFFKR